MGKTRKYNFRKRNNKSLKRNKYLSKSRKSKNRNNILNHSFYENSKNGGYGTIIIEQSNLLDKKIELVESFKIFDEIFEQMKQKSKIKIPSYLDFKMSTYIDGIVTINYPNPIVYSIFEEFYNKLKDNNIVQCDDCKHYTVSLPGTGTALYPIYKIYFTIGYIISYYYRNPHKFINEEYLKTNFQLNSTLLFFKDVLTNLLCNKLYQTSNQCNIPMGFEDFIQKNNFNVNENLEITKAVFIFFNSIKNIPIIGNLHSIHVFINKFVDPKLDPNVYP
jgi:hypothetical protein